MREQLPPGPALDERVCRALGWEPATLEVCGVAFTTESHAQLAAKSQGGAVIIRRWWKASTDGNVMLRAIEAMRERGWDGFKVETLGDMSLNRGYWQKEGLWYCWFSGERGIRMKGGFHGETPAHSVALAIIAALEPEASDA